MKRQRSNFEKITSDEVSAVTCRDARSEITVAARGEATSHIVKASPRDSATRIIPNQMQVLPKDPRKKERIMCSLAETLSRLWCSKPLPGIVCVQKASKKQTNTRSRRIVRLFI